MALNKNFFKSYNNILAKISNEIKKSNKIAVISHVDPDGDAVGSQLALYQALFNRGDNIDLINAGPYENKFITSNKKLFNKKIKDEYDLFIVVDTPSIDRAGDIGNIDTGKTIVIDHHITNTGFGKINWVDNKFISTCEMIYLLLDYLNIGLDNINICQNLLNGIISDNGFYRHVRIEKNLSLLISYLLTEKKADPKKSYDIIYGKKSISSKKLLSIALNRIQSISNNKILWTYISDEDKKNNNNSMVDSAVIFNELMSIDKVEIGIFFKVSDNSCKVSFRATELYDVAELATIFGGGGHKAASGATIKGSFDDIKDKVLTEAKKILKNC